MESVSGVFTADTMEEMNWESVTEEMRQKCPCTTTLLDAALPTAGTIRRHYRSASGLVDITITL
jgi:hypothetical protein